MNEATPTLRFEPLTPAEVPAMLSASTGQLVVVYLHGADCPNCEAFERAQPKVLSKLGAAPESSRVKLVEIDVYEHQDFATQHGVYGIPTFLLFRNGTKVGRMTSFRGTDFWVDVVVEQARLVE